MDRSICPYLGTLDADYNRGPHMDYPSFENICMSRDDDGNALLLTDQATYCLSSGHIYCPRYRATRSATTQSYDNPPAAKRYIESPARIPEWHDNDFDRQPDSTINHQFDSHQFDRHQSDRHQFDRHQSDRQLDSKFHNKALSWNPQTDGLLDDAYQDEFDEEPITPIDLGGRGAWLSAGMLFLAMLLCGGMLSIYTGWDVVSQRVADQAALQQRQDRPAVVEIAADDPSARQLFSDQFSQQSFMIITAVPQGEGGPSSPNLPQAVAQAGPATPTARVLLITPGKPTPTPTVGIIPLGHTQTPTPVPPTSIPPTSVPPTPIPPTPIPPTPTFETFDYPESVTATPEIILIPTPSPMPVVQAAAAAGPVSGYFVPDNGPAGDNAPDGLIPGTFIPNEMPNNNGQVQNVFIDPTTGLPFPQLINPVINPYAYFANPAAFGSQPVAEAVPPTPTSTPTFTPTFTPMPTLTPEPSLTPVPSPTAADLTGVLSGGTFIVDANQVSGPGESGGFNGQPNTEVPPTATPTATPTWTPTATLTPTPTETWGPPIVIFGAADRELREGECTKISWFVDNVAEVFYEGRGVNGEGEQTECIYTNSADYILEVRLPSGELRSEVVHVELLLPTATPIPTWTFTPPPNPSPTWTPAFPSATPTPSVIYDTMLVANGGISHTCFIGQTCEISLTATNRGSHNDDLAISLSRVGPWLPQLCRTDGVCAGDRLIITNVGPHNTALIVLRLMIPENTSRQTVLYALYSSSNHSGGIIRSGDVLLEIEAK